MFDKKIKMDRTVYDAAKKFADEQGYSSVEEFVTHLVEKEIARTAEAQSAEEIRKKMQGLGYFS